MRLCKPPGPRGNLLGIVHLPQLLPVYLKHLQQTGGSRNPVFVLGVGREFGRVIEAFSQRPTSGVVCAQRRVQIKENSPIIIPDP